MTLVAVALCLAAGTGTASADVYDNYAQLRAAQREGVDYLITRYEPASSDPAIAHIAIHGGRIEAGTSPLALYAAEKSHTTGYTFQAIKSENNTALHITATHFDEPNARRIVGNSYYTVSWHGKEGNTPITYLGGGDNDISAQVGTALKHAGFVVEDAPERIDGDSPRNIANLNKRGEGVQLELTTAQRRAFFDGGNLDLDWTRNRSHWTPAFYRYVNAVLSVYERVPVPSNG